MASDLITVAVPALLLASLAGVFWALGTDRKGVAFTVVGVIVVAVGLAIVWTN